MPFYLQYLIVFNRITPSTGLKSPAVPLADQFSHVNMQFLCQRD